MATTDIWYSLFKYSIFTESQNCAFFGFGFDGDVSIGGPAVNLEKESRSGGSVEIGVFKKDRYNFIFTGFGCLLYKTRCARACVRACMCV